VVLDAARGASPATHPEKLLLIFSHGVGADIDGAGGWFWGRGDRLLVEFIGLSKDKDERKGGLPQHE